LELAESGEEVGRFCRRHRLHAPTLKWWRWRLAGSVLAERAEPAEPSVPQFTEIRWRELVVASGAAAGFELLWSDGLRLRIPSEFDEGALRRLLSVLEAVGC